MCARECRRYSGLSEKTLAFTSRKPKTRYVRVVVNCLHVINKMYAILMSLLFLQVTVCAGHEGCAAKSGVLVPVHRAPLKFRLVKFVDLASITFCLHERIKTVGNNGNPES